MQDRTYRVCTREALHQLVTDIACLQIGEHQHIRLACHGRTRRLRRRHFLYQRSVRLQLAVDIQIGSQLLSNTRCLHYLIYQLMLSRALRRERQHRHFRLKAAQRTSRLRRRDSNLCQLLCIRIRVNRTVCKHKETALAQLLSRREHQERTRHNRHARLGLQYLECRTNSVCRRAAGTCQLAICVAVLYHQTAQVQRVLRLLRCLFLGHTFRLAQLIQQVRILCHLRVVLRVKQRRLLNVLITLLRCHLTNNSRVANQNQFGNLITQNNVRCLQCTGFIALRQHNALLVLLCALQHFCKYIHNT